MTNHLLKKYNSIESDQYFSIYQTIKALSTYLKIKTDCRVLRTKAVCWESILEFENY